MVLWVLSNCSSSGRTDITRLAESSWSVTLHSSMCSSVLLGYWYFSEHQIITCAETFFNSDVKRQHQNVLDLLHQQIMLDYENLFHSLRPHVWKSAVIAVVYLFNVFEFKLHLQSPIFAHSSSLATLLLFGKLSNYLQRWQRPETQYAATHRAKKHGQVLMLSNQHPSMFKVDPSMKVKYTVCKVIFSELCQAVSNLAQTWWMFFNFFCHLSNQVHAEKKGHLNNY